MKIFKTAFQYSEIKFIFIIILSAYLLERFLMNHKLETLSIVYKKLDLLKPDKNQKLLKDVAELTGKTVLKIRIRRIDYKKKTAVLDIYCND